MCFAGLKLLNISLDSLQEERFEAMTRRRGLSRVLDTISDAVRQGFDPVKVRLVPITAAFHFGGVHW